MTHPPVGVSSEYRADFLTGSPSDHLRPVRSPQQNRDLLSPHTFKKYVPSSLRRSIKPLIMSRGFDGIARLFQGQVTCLTYHSLTTQRYQPTTFDPNIGLRVHVESFEEQLKYLSKNAIISDLETALTSVSGRDQNHRVVLTFDDGYLDFKTLVLPLLEKYNAPATLFITTDFVSRTGTLWWEELERHIRALNSVVVTNPQSKEKISESALQRLSAKNIVYSKLRRWILNGTEEVKANILEQLRQQSGLEFCYKDLLNWDEVRELSRHPLVTIGSHSVSHPNFRLLSNVEKDFQLSESKRILEQELGIPVNSFAFPVGSRDQAGQDDFDRILKNGYTCGVTSRVAHWQKKHANHAGALPRIHVDYSDSAERFAWKLSGREAFMWSPLSRFVTE